MSCVYFTYCVPTDTAQNNWNRALLKVTISVISDHVYDTANELDAPVKYSFGESFVFLDEPKCLSLYTPEQASFGISHSMVAMLYK